MKRTPLSLCIRLICIVFVFAFSSLHLAAQDLVFKMSEEPTTLTGDQATLVKNNVTIAYCRSSSSGNALLYSYNYAVYGYRIQVSSPGKTMANIEFVGQAVSNRTGDVTVLAGGGTLTGDFDTYFHWQGSTHSVTFCGASNKSGSDVTEIRIWFEGTPYSEGSGGGYVEEFDISKHTGSPIDDPHWARAKTRPTDGRGVNMAVVSHTKFRSTLQPYLLWKTQQGYSVTEVYADDVAAKTGKADTELAYAIRDELMKLSEQPAYILICGDVDEVPSFKNIVHQAESVNGSPARVPCATDFYYGEFTGDYFQEAYVGRFSANNTEQLQAQMDKTKYMAFIKPSEASWLQNSLIVHEPASDIATEKSVDFSRAYFQELGCSSTTTSAYSSSVSPVINSGCSHVTYIGHGSINSWRGYYTTYNVSQLANANRYPVVLGLTCLSGAFDAGGATCMGEEFLRKPNGGAVAYIGATRESWDGTNNLLLRGGNGALQSFEHIGYLRSLFPVTDEDRSQRSRTIGEAMAVGTFSSRFLGETTYRQAAEFYVLFGDPTYQPYCKTPLQMTIAAASSVTAGHCLQVTTAPEAMVAISQGRTVIAAGMADAEGRISLKIPRDALTGSCTLYSSAIGYNDYYKPLTVLPSDGREDSEPTTELPAVLFTDVLTIEGVKPTDTMEPCLYTAPSGTKYTMWVANEKAIGAQPELFLHWDNRQGTPRPRAISMKAPYSADNPYQCGIAVAQNAANSYARTVTVEWLHPTGQTEKLAIYGSLTPFPEAAYGWDNGTANKLGEIRKGEGNSLVIEGNWPYISIRPDIYETCPKAYDDIFIKSLAIGWSDERQDIEEQTEFTVADVARIIDEAQKGKANLDDVNGIADIVLDTPPHASRTFARKYVLVEKHTGVYCPNCTTADAAFADYLNRHSGFDGRVIEIRHNSYSTRLDKYFLPIVKELASTWEVGGWPRYFVNRSSYEGLKYANAGGLSITGANFGYDYFDPITPQLQKASYVSLSLYGSTYDPATRQLSVRVHGEVSKTLPDLCVNVFLVQDDGGYENITRASLTRNINGDPIKPDANGHYDVCFTTTIADSYGYGNSNMQQLAADPSKMKVVAFVSSFDDYKYPAASGKDFSDSDVHNVDYVSVTALNPPTPFRH